MISAAEIPIGGPIGRADIDMSDACVNLELLFGTDFSDDERVLTSTTGSESNMAGDDEQVFYLQRALEFLETYIWYGTNYDFSLHNCTYEINRFLFINHTSITDKKANNGQSQQCAPSTGPRGCTPSGHNFRMGYNATATLLVRKDREDAMPWCRDWSWKVNTSCLTWVFSIGIVIF